jgi:hypothetical protein
LTVPYQVAFSESKRHLKFDDLPAGTFDVNTLHVILTLAQ